MAREKKDTEQATGVAAWNEGRRTRRSGSSSGDRRAASTTDRRRRVGLLVALAVYALLTVAWQMLLARRNEA